MEKEQSIWVMYERSDIDQDLKYDDFRNYGSKSWVFADFETARKAMRNRIVELAAGRNALFHEPGEMLDLNSYSMSCICAGYTDVFRALHKALHSFLTNPDYPETKEDLRTCLELFPVQSIYSRYHNGYPEEEGWDDGFTLRFGITDSEEPELICKNIGYDAVMYAADHFGYNTMPPYIYINCFIMNDPDKKYSFHIKNGFDESARNYQSSVFLELEKVDY